MRALGGALAVWLREFTVFKRETSRVISAVLQPLMWILLFGGGLGGSVGRGASVALPAGIDYQQYIFPGILMMSVLFSSVFYGMYLVWDRKIDVLKAVLVSPVPRPAIFLGKVLGGCTDVLIQSAILLVVGAVILRLPLGRYALAILPSLGVILLAAMGTVSIGLTIGSRFESMEGFQVVGTFVNFPLFFLSGALFPLGAALRASQPLLFHLAHADPITYPVDALRGILFGANLFPMALDLAVMVGFAAVMVAIGGFAFGRMRL
ncbi:MAG TPA: ABC transporter permease [Gemmatimonadales bacterium]|nr:ABC transporter permease [Gemmatimonadales bacterium]